MRRLQILEEQKAWKREAGYDRIMIIAEICEQHSFGGFCSEPFYSKLYNPRWPHTPEEHSLEMRVNIERLRMGVVLSQPAPPPQFDSSPRRWPAVGTGSDKPGVSRAGTESTERKYSFSSSSQYRWFSTRLHKSETGNYYFALSWHRSERRNNNYKITSRRKTVNWPATAKDCLARAKQAVCPWRVTGSRYFQSKRICFVFLFFVRMSCVYFVLYFCVFFLSVIVPSRYER